MKLNFLPKLLVSVFVACGVMFFTGCSDDDEKTNNSIVGTWEGYEGDTRIVSYAKQGGTGSYQMFYKSELLYSADFSWTQNGKTVTIVINGTSYSLTFNGGNQFTVDGVTFRRK